jgi:hypothetical protein
MAKSKGLFVFSKIFRYIENSISGEVHFSDMSWRMNFTIEYEPETILLDADEKDALPLAKTKFDAEIRLFAHDPYDANPEEIYV